MVQVRHKRMRLLATWYDLNSPKQMAHRSCLAALGLHPFPFGVDLSERMNAEIQRKIGELAVRCACIRDPTRMARIVGDQLFRDIRMPYWDGRQELRPGVRPRTAGGPETTHGVGLDHHSLGRRSAGHRSRRRGHRGG